MPWWVYVVIALALTHITIATVTIYLHRYQTHKAIDMHPALSHFFRAWLWLTTGMVTKEWVAIHRKHHAKCETVDDPHSPQIHGIWKVLLGGVLLYVKESHNQETMDKFGTGTPDDWLEKNVYSDLPMFGLLLMQIIDLVMFGAAGFYIFIVQIIWIPFWAAGVINGIGHYWGYQNFKPEATGQFSNVFESRNILPIGIFIGGEELHNNHHAYPTSAKFSNKWYEFDLGWMYIRILEHFKLATIKE